MKPCELVVNESRTAANLDERKPAPPRRGENKRAKERQKKKKRPSRACKGSALKHRMTSMEKDVFLHAEDGVGENLGRRT